MHAENGQTALALLRKDPSKIRLVLLDIVMPIMDGVELLTVIKVYLQGISSQNIPNRSPPQPPRRRFHFILFHFCSTARHFTHSLADPAMLLGYFSQNFPLKREARALGLTIICLYHGNLGGAAHSFEDCTKCCRLPPPSSCRPPDVLHTAALPFFVREMLLYGTFRW